MLGAIIGDIVGSRFEFNNTSDFHFELFSPECDFIDDPIKVVALTYLPTDIMNIYAQFVEKIAPK